MGTNMSARRNIQLLMVALSVLLSAACTKIAGPGDDGWTELGGDRPVNFSSSLATPATKTTTTLPHNTQFGVYAFYQPGVIGGTPGSWSQLSTKQWTPNFMFNQQVTFKIVSSTSHTYTYSPLRYWPSNAENTISFWAYHPRLSNPDFLVANSATDQYQKTSVGLPDIRYSTNGKKDLLVSDLVADQSRTTTFDPVSFSFHHALSKIDFKVQKVDDPANAYTVTLTSISFTNIYNEGILRNVGSESGRSWYLASSHTSSLPVFTGTVPVESAESSIISDASVIVIPQTFTSSTNGMLRVEYKLSWTGSGNPRTNVCLCPLTGSWDINQHYIYTLRITPNMPIEFEVEWTEWGDANNYHLTS